MIWERLKGKKIIIYGTGFVASRFYQIMKDHGMQDQIQFFVKTRNVAAGETFKGMQVYAFRNISIDEDNLICLAVHESIRDEIENEVKLKEGQYIWIYPYLYEMMLGEAEQRNVELKIAEIVKKNNADLRLGVRLAAIEQKSGKNTFGFDYYIRANMIHCSLDTAEKRLKQFEKMIENWKQSGYRKDCLIKVNRNYEVIDGNHRLSMAVYMRQETIYGDIYPAEVPIEEIIGEAILTKSLLSQHGFTANEIERLESIQQRYLKAYENKQNCSSQHYHPCI